MIEKSGCVVQTPMRLHWVREDSPPPIAANETRTSSRDRDVEFGSSDAVSSLQEVSRWMSMTGDMHIIIHNKRTSQFRAFSCRLRAARVNNGNENRQGTNKERDSDALVCVWLQPAGPISGCRKGSLKWIDIFEHA